MAFEEGDGPIVRASHKPVLAIIGPSGVGKTTLLVQLIPLLNAIGLRVGLVKHSHHDFEIDQPGKDSYRLRKAGATPVLLTSPYRTALIAEGSGEEPSFSDCLKHFEGFDCDLILVEGFKSVSYPKLLVHRANYGKSWAQPKDDTLLAVVTDSPLQSGLIELPINDPEVVAAFVVQHFFPSC
jgi:molybdopterin-guanine dinucleotide biosynthesis protein MobB